MQAKMTNSQTQLADVIMSTTAAPVYFPPHELGGYSLVDGGIAANNPTIFALHEAATMTENRANRGSPDYSKFLVLSLGTGSAKLNGHKIESGGLIDWILSMTSGSPPLIDVLFRASDDMVDMCTALILGHYNSMHNFLRIQDYTLDPNRIKLNDASKSNIEALEEAARKLLHRPITLVNPLTGLQEEIPKDGSLLLNGRAPTNYEAVTSFAKRLSAERRRRAYRTKKIIPNMGRR
ncbi:Patatin protein 3 [Spatholobus suberectus]|nr:Patatin protein 3 [Spatholobus suberectus]